MCSMSVAVPTAACHVLLLRAPTPMHARHQSHMHHTPAGQHPCTTGAGDRSVASCQQHHVCAPAPHLLVLRRVQCVALLVKELVGARRGGQEAAGARAAGVSSSRQMREHTFYLAAAAAAAAAAAVMALVYATKHLGCRDAQPSPAQPSPAQPSPAQRRSACSRMWASPCQ